MKALENVRKFTTLKLVLLVLLVFCCQMIFLGFSDDVEMDASIGVEGAELAGVGWTDILPGWFLNLFAQGEWVETTAGVGWTDILPGWFINLFAQGQGVETTAGVGWTDILPGWFLNLFAANEAEATVAGVGWTDFMPLWLINLLG